MNSIRRLRLASLLSAVLLFASGELCMLVNCTLRPAREAAAAAAMARAEAPACPACHHPTAAAATPGPAGRAPAESAMPCCISVTLATAPAFAPPAADVPTPLPAALLAAAIDPLAALAMRQAPTFARQHAPPAVPPPTSRLLRAPPSA